MQPILAFLVAAVATAQVPPVSGKLVPPSYDELKAAYADAKPPAKKDLLGGGWTLETEARDPKTRDRLAVLTIMLADKLGARKSLFQEISFEHPKWAQALKLSFPLPLFKDGKAKAAGAMLTDCKAEDGATSCGSRFSFRQRDDEGFITILSADWKLSFKSSGGKLLCETTWKYKVWHQCPDKGPKCPLAAIPFAEPLGLDETATRLSVYSRKAPPAASSARDR